MGTFGGMLDTLDYMLSQIEPKYGNKNMESAQNSKMAGN